MSDYKEIYAGEGNKSFYPILNKGVRVFFFIRSHNITDMADVCR